MGNKKFFVRKSVLDIKENDNDLWTKTFGVFEVFFFSEEHIKHRLITVGDHELVEVELKVVDVRPT